jgi:hypothetical protein
VIHCVFSFPVAVYWIAQADMRPRMVVLVLVDVDGDATAPPDGSAG